MASPQPLRFWVYLVPVIPSMVCSVFLLYHLLTRRALRTAIHNHVIIVMIAFGFLYEVTNIVWYLHFYRTGNLVSATPAFCRIWVFIDGAVYVIIAMLMAWASLERHILIFHHHWMAPGMKRFFFHYCPLIICAAYPTIFYGSIFFFIPCNIPFDYSLATCNYYACISWTHSLSFWDSILNFVLPAFLIVVFSIALLVRVLYRRSRVRRRVEWRNHWKMAVQLLSMSVIYFVFLLPPMSLNTAYTIGLPWDGGSDYYWATMYLGYFTVLLTPFVCILLLPEVSSKLKKLCRSRRTRAVVPAWTISNRANRTPIVTATGVKF